MKKFKLGAGPMSVDIINLLIEYSSTFEFPVMIIASRNQVDYDCGYVCTTAQLAAQVKQHPLYNKDLILLCRDHCGPYFSDADQALSLSEALARCKMTMDADIENGFDLIHVDVSRIPSDQLTYAKELIEYAISLNPNIMLEFGSEDNTSENIQDSLLRLDEQLNFLAAYNQHVKFFVTQTGSLTKHTQVGTFDVVRNTLVADKIHQHGFLFKEHNADYLTPSQVKLRPIAGVDALNIAPELGTVQTKLICSIGKNIPSFSKFYEHVLAQGYWKRWVTSDVDSRTTFVEAGGHYCFHGDLYSELYASLVNLNFKELLKIKVFNTLDTYRKGLQDETTL